jgi:ketosteroid isomerase-like protein
MTMLARLNVYREAFNARDLSGAMALFEDHALFEMPLFGQRLVGKAEIAAGLRQVFALTESAQLQLSHSKESATLIIAEGSLRAKLHRDEHSAEIPCAVVLETRETLIGRLSMYLDARLHRLWADGPIFPVSQPGRV